LTAVTKVPFKEAIARNIGSTVKKTMGPSTMRGLGGGHILSWGPRRKENNLI